MHFLHGRLLENRILREEEEGSALTHPPSFAIKVEEPATGCLRSPRDPE
jgi:hypothetical protein